MTSRAIVVTVAAAVAAGGASLALVLTSTHESEKAAVATAGLLLGWSFIGAGLLARLRRPENASGLLMLAVGFTWFVGSLSEANGSIAYTIGLALGNVFLGCFVHLLVAYPRGLLSSRAERLIVGATYAAAVLSRPTLALVNPRPDAGCDGCPHNALLVVDSGTLQTVQLVFWDSVGAVIAAAVVVVVGRRWRQASRASRRIFGPVYLSGVATMLLLGVSFALEPAVSGAAKQVALVGLIAFISVPYLFLAGLLRSRLARAGATQLLVDTPSSPTVAEAEASLRRALHDPSLRLFVWLDDAGGYVDAAGDRAQVPPETRESVTTPIDYEGRPLAALVHDPSVREERELFENVLAAARLGLAKDRGLRELQAAERRQRALLAAIPDYIFRIARDGTYLDVHAHAMNEVLARADFIGSRIADHLPRDVADELGAIIERVVDTGEPATYEHELEHRGERSAFEARIVKSGDDEVISIVRDVTDRRRQEDELRRLYAELEERLRELERERDFTRTVVNMAPTYFCVVDLEGHVVRFNATLERMTGVADTAEARGRPLWELFAVEDDRDGVREMVRRGGIWRVPAADGDARTVAWWSSPVHDGRGRELVLLCGLDITERERHEAELRRSRARIVEAGDAERRRLERNLHDGAQQRLVALSLSLRLARGKLESDPAAAGGILDAAAAELAQALEELRELARGIHPAILTDRGLGPALEALRSRAPLPVDLDELPSERLPAPVEAAAFYVVSEAVTNVVKYAQADSVSVRVARANGVAVVEVADDGVGGADPDAGSGLRGLVDRVEALDGRIEIVSRPGRGTRVRAEIPCES